MRSWPGRPRSLTGCSTVRRMFGGALWNAWPFALLARHYAEGFVDWLKAAVAVSEDFIRAVRSSHAQVERVPNGTNISGCWWPRRGHRVRSRAPAGSGRASAGRRQAPNGSGIHPAGQRNLESHERRQTRRADQPSPDPLTFETRSPVYTRPAMSGSSMKVRDIPGKPSTPCPPIDTLQYPSRLLGGISPGDCRSENGVDQRSRLLDSRLRAGDR